MELLFLGTGAADWQGPLESGEERLFSCLLLDDHLLFDCGPTCLTGLARQGRDPAGIEAIFVTHSHSDHFDQAILTELSEIRQARGLARLQVFVEASWLKELDLPGADLIGLVPEKPLHYKDYVLTALAANHISSYSAETALHFLVQQKEKSFLYATDGAWLLTRTWRYLRQLQLDLAIFDCTMGPDFAADWRSFEHNSLSMVQAMTGILKTNAVLKKDAPVILTHLARTLHPSQAELDKLLEKPFLAARDGYLHRL